MMADWRISFHDLLEMYNIPPSCVYNGDQMGLYYQKLPNRMYVDKDAKKTYAGVKQMKDKTRITLMVCTAADGSDVPLSIVGKPKKICALECYVVASLPSPTRTIIVPGLIRILQFGGS